MIFGKAVERDGITVIPVAKMKWGGGAGGGTTSHGGAGVIVTPVGYLEVRAGKARFRPMLDLGTLASLVMSVGMASMLMLRGVRKLIRK